TPGLRREEVAQLSGVGVTWYTWLEQGREITASIQVIDALARALLLTPDQHRHLRELAGLPPPEPPAPTGELMPRLQRLVDAAPRLGLCGTSPTHASGTTPARSSAIAATCSGLCSPAQKTAPAWSTGNRRRGPCSASSAPLPDGTPRTPASPSWWLGSPRPAR